MSQNLINLFSDTQTKPTKAMRQAIANAEVGDEQLDADPTTIRLQDMVAELLGKEAALFLPSGVMCNQISLKVLTNPGDEILLHESAHIENFESGGAAALSGLMTKTIPGERGMFYAEQVSEAMRPRGRYHPYQSLLAVEQTANLGGGTIWPLDQIQSVCDVARENGLKTHLDGARIFNAVVETGISASEYAAPFDSAWIDLTKGLGCPVGSVMAGSKEFIDQARRYKFIFGGAMRQSGIIAAAGIYALENNIERLREDHENARYFADLIKEIPGVRLTEENVETNMVFFSVSETGLNAEEISARLHERGINIWAFSETSLRVVTHLDVSRKDIETAAQALAIVCSEQYP